MYVMLWSIIFFTCIIALACTAIKAGPLTSLRRLGFQLIYQFEKGVSLENIAARSNGQLPVTQIDQPEIYQVNRQAPTLLGTVQYATRLFSIAEISTDIFAFVAGNYSSAALSLMLDSFSIWTIDMRAMASSDPPTRPSMRISKVMYIGSAMSLNGMTALQPQLHVTAG